MILSVCSILISRSNKLAWFHTGCFNQNFLALMFTSLTKGLKICARLDLSQWIQHSTSSVPGVRQVMYQIFPEMIYLDPWCLKWLNLNFYPSTQIISKAMAIIRSPPHLMIALGIFCAYDFCFFKLIFLYIQTVQYVSNNFHHQSTYQWGWKTIYFYLFRNKYKKSEILPSQIYDFF